MPKPKTRRIPKPIWFGIAAVLMVGISLVSFVAGYRSSSTQDSPVAEAEQSGEEPNMYSVRTEFAFRKKMLGMTRESIESEIGTGESWLVNGPEEVEIYSYPMLYDASLEIWYDNDRAIGMQINGELNADESPTWYSWQPTE